MLIKNSERSASKYDLVELLLVVNDNLVVLTIDLLLVVRCENRFLLVDNPSNNVP